MTDKSQDHQMLKNKVNDHYKKSIFQVYPHFTGVRQDETKKYFCKLRKWQRERDVEVMRRIVPLTWGINKLSHFTSAQAVPTIPYFPDLNEFYKTWMCTDQSTYKVDAYKVVSIV